MTKNTNLGNYSSSASGLSKIDNIVLVGEAVNNAPKITDMIKDDGSTFLHDAASGKEIKIDPAEMIDHLVIVDKLNKDNCTALHLAIQNGKLLDFVPRMIDNMSQRAIEATSSIDGNTALHYAIDQGRFDIAEKLIARMGTDALVKENHYKSNGIDNVQISALAFAESKAKDAYTKLESSVTMKEGAKHIQYYAQRDLGYGKLVQKLKEKLSNQVDHHSIPPAAIDHAVKRSPGR
jgi:ankyrin repeat protein